MTAYSLRGYRVLPRLGLFSEERVCSKMNRLFPSRVAPTERETERTMVESHFNLITDGIHPSIQQTYMCPVCSKGVNIYTAFNVECWLVDLGLTAL